LVSQRFAAASAALQDLSEAIRLQRLLVVFDTSYLFADIQYCADLIGHRLESREDRKMLLLKLEGNFNLVLTKKTFIPEEHLSQLAELYSMRSQVYAILGEMELGRVRFWRTVSQIHTVTG
jgi:hypothetical protein